MEAMVLVRTLGALGAVLGLLLVATWAVRRFDLKLPGLAARLDGRGKPRLGVVERLALDQKRALVLVRDGEAEHLLLLGPEGAMVVRAEAPSPAPRPRDSRIGLVDLMPASHTSAFRPIVGSRS